MPNKDKKNAARTRGMLEITKARKQNEHGTGEHSNCIRSGGTCALFGGLENVADLHKFQLHPRVLECVLLWHDQCKGAKELFPSDLRAFVGKFQRAEGESSHILNRNRCHVAAGLVVNIFRLVEEGSSLTKSDFQEEHKKMVTKTMDAFEIEIPEVDNIADIKFPQLGHFEELSEAPLQKFDRAQVILRNLDYLLSAKGKWKSEKFLKHHPVADQCKPEWMRKDLKARLLENQTWNCRPGLAPRQISIECIPPDPLSYLGPLDDYVKNLLTPKGLSLPTEIIGFYDPRQYLMPEEWRDHIRQKAGFEELSVDFLEMTVHMMSPDGESHYLKNIYQNADGRSRKMPWEEFQDFVEGEGKRSVHICYSLQYVDISEDGPHNGYPYKYEGVPRAFDNSSSLNDIQLKN
ncbi:hypothetical protein MMC25_007904 [Agyrium rufum]|nr:hypothetical protein [Agyrium rufum]